MGFKSDIEIAQECTMEPITKIAEKAGIDDKYLEQYGKYKAKIDYNLLKETDKKDGKLIPKIKISENVGKITNPHFKKVYRIFDKATGKAEADYITVWDEVIEEGQPLELFDPDATWKRRTYTDYTIKPLQEKIFEHGQLVYQQPTLPEIQKYCREQIDTLWDEVKRFENPHNYYVDLSQKLWDIKQDLLRKNYR